MDRSAVTADIICEIGPVGVRRIGGATTGPARTVDESLTSAALDSDDPVLLVGVQAMTRDEVWQAVLEPMLRADERTVLVHPSWWPEARIDTIRQVAGRLCDDVGTRPRSWLLAAVAGRAPIVEIGPQVVLVTVDGEVVFGLQRRAATPGEVTEAIVRVVLRSTRGGTVWIDAPSGVAGADALAAQIAGRLKPTGHLMHRVADRHMLSACLLYTSPSPRDRS